MDLVLFGETCALLAAIMWGLAVVLFKQSTLHLSPLHLNIFKSTVGMVLLVATLPLVSDLSELREASWSDLAILAVSGLIGIALADTLFFMGLARIGVGLMSVVDCVYAPSVIFFSWQLLGEQITIAHFIGMGLIVSGVWLCSRHAPPPDRTRGQLISGIVLGVVAIACMAFGIVYAKSVLDRFSVIGATTIRLGAALVPLVLLALALPDRRAMQRAFAPSRAWRVTVPAAVVGNYLSLLLWVAGFKYAPAAINGILNQTSIIFAVVFATLMLREPLTRRKVAALTLAFGGVLVVILGGPEHTPVVLPAAEP